MATPPQYIIDAARDGLRHYAMGHGGAGITDGTLREARSMAKGIVSDDKIMRANAWQARHAVDLDAPQNSNADDKDYPGAGAVAHMLWGFDPLDPQPARDWFREQLISINKKNKMSSKTYSLNAMQFGKIYPDQALIMGVSVITQGDAIGHGVMIDEQSLITIQECAQTYARGLKVKLNHEDGVDNIIGIMQNFVIDGPQLRADLQLLKASPDTALIIEMAQIMPESFGMSISFSGNLEEIDGVMYVRCIEIYSCDIVDMPAANPAGLFSAIVDSTQNVMELQAITIELSAEKELRAAAQEQAKKNYGDLQNQLVNNATLSSERDGLITQLSALLETNEKLTTELAAAQTNITERINAEAVRVLASAGCAPVAIGTNTSGVITSMTRSEFSALTAYRKSEFSKAGGRITD
jgi:hypothetical protein